MIRRIASGWVLPQLEFKRLKSFLQGEHTPLHLCKNILAKLHFLFRNPKCKGAAGCFPGNVYHQTCQEIVVWIEIHKPTGWSLLQHHGMHTHPWPKAKKADQLSKDLLEAQVRENPKAKAFQLKLGFSLPYPWVSFILIGLSFCILPSRWEAVLARMVNFRVSLKSTNL